MGMKTELRHWSNAADHGLMLYLWCPGCDDVHGVSVESTSGSVWQWDGNRDLPSIYPSILVSGVQWQEGHTFHKGNHAIGVGEKTTCHSFVRNGKWEFLGDCPHTLAGQTVSVIDLPEWWGKA